jgi:hypothetical protein
MIEQFVRWLGPIWLWLGSSIENAWGGGVGPGDH